MRTASHPLEKKDRHVIASGTEVLGGVLRTRAGIVVDVEENPDPYQATLEAIDKEVSGTGHPEPIHFLKAIHRAATDRICHSPNDYRMMLKEEAISRGLKHMTPYDNIGLSRFLNAKTGICHQYALLSATMLRLLQERGDLPGEVSIESTLPNDTRPDRHIEVAFSIPGENFSLDVVGAITSDIRNAFALAKA